MSRRAIRRAPHSKLQRWTDLIAALLARRAGATFDQLARDVPAYADGLDPAHKHSVKRTFERDKDELRDFGVPIETLDADDENETRYRLRPDDFYLPFLALPADGSQARGRNVPVEGYRAVPTVALTPADLDLLGDAVARLADLGDPTLAEDARSAAGKLAFDLPVFDASSTDVHLLDASGGADPKVFYTLSDALRRRKILTFRYEKPSGPAAEIRTVSPYGLFFVNAHWYLAARDNEGGDDAASAVRSFRVSRMRDVSMNRKRPKTPDFDVPHPFRLRDYAQSREAWELGDTPTVYAHVRFIGTSGAVAAAVRGGEAVAGQEHIRRYPVRRLETFTRWLLSLAGEAIPVSPPELMDLYRAAVRDTLALYGRRA